MSKSKELTTKPLTSAEIEKDCPAEVQALGHRIAAHYDKLVNCEDKAEQHKVTIGQLLAQAKELCDVGGYTAFRQRFCPKLGKSRAHELLAIAAGRKTIEQTKTRSRERQAKHRAKTKAKLAEAERQLVRDKPEAEIAPERPLVTDKPEAEIEVERPLVTDKPEAEIEVEHPLVTDKPGHKAVNPKDNALCEFNEKILRLVQMTRDRKPERFAKTSVPVAELSQLGRFLEGVAAAASGARVDG